MSFEESDNGDRSSTFGVSAKQQKSRWSNQSSKDVESGFLSAGRSHQDAVMNIVWKKGFIRLFFVGGILWIFLILFASLFHVWSCHSSISFHSAVCNKDSKVFTVWSTIGVVTNPQPHHRCTIPVANDPEKTVIPEGRTPDKIVKKLSYVIKADNGSYGMPLFGGNQSWAEREREFQAEANHEDEVSFDFIKENVTVTEDKNGGQWVGIWHLILLKHSPYDEPRRNGKVPKILTHRLFPEARYGIWIDGKMELIFDPLLILERYLWRGKHTYAIAQH